MDGRDSSAAPRNDMGSYGGNDTGDLVARVEDGLGWGTAGELL